MIIIWSFWIAKLNFIVANFPRTISVPHLNQSSNPKSKFSKTTYMVISNINSSHLLVDTSLISYTKYEPSLALQKLTQYNSTFYFLQVVFEKFVSNMIRQRFGDKFSLILSLRYNYFVGLISEEFSDRFWNID